MTATIPETATAEADEAAKPPRKKKKKLVLLLVVLLLVGGGGYVFLGHGKAKKPTAPEPGAVVALEPITVNLAGGHYLRIGLALQLAKGRVLGSDPEATDPAAAGARADDEAITVFGGQSVDALSAGGRDKLKATLLKKLESDYDGAVIDLYFTEFVMQ